LSNIPKKYKGSRGKAALNPIFSVALILLVLVGGYFGGKALGWWGAAPVIPGADPTAYTFTVTEVRTGVLIEDFNVTEYRYEILETDTDADLEELVYADYTAEAIAAAHLNDEFDIEAEYKQVFLISATGYSSKWVNPAAGVNYVELVNQSADINMMAFETDGGSSTVNDTSDYEWTVMFVATTTDTDYPEGFDSSNYDFVNDAFDYVAVKVTFNTTAVANWAKMDGALTEVLSGSTLIYYFTADCFSDEWNTELLEFNDSKLNDDFHVHSIALCYGNADSTLTVLDTQS
jgi:hypothetical protein